MFGYLGSVKGGGRDKIILQNNYFAVIGYGKFCGNGPIWITYFIAKVHTLLALQPLDTNKP